MSQVMDYFATSEVWLNKILSGLSLDYASSLGLGAAECNWRLVQYEGGAGSCLPHRDFGLLTLVEQSGVAGLQLEHRGKFVTVPGHCSVLLAGW